VIKMAKLILLLASLVFLGIGVVFLVAPVHWAALVEIELPTSMARTDLRATYGGFDLGFGAFLLLCALRAEWIRPGLAATSIALAGFAGGRTLGMLLEGAASPLMLTLAALEWSGAILAFLLCRRTDSKGSRM
jgi:Domain of unknown function (DUF4345)